MAEQIITVASIAWPQPGKKQGAVFDTNNQRWGVFPNDLGSFTQGATYKVWDWQVSMFNGKEYRTIKSENFQFMGGGSAAAQQQPQQRLNGQTRSTPLHQQTGSLSSGLDLERRRDIFVCGAFNNIMSNPGNAGLHDDGQAMTKLVWRLRKVWDYSLGPHARDPSFTSGPPASDTPEGQAQASQGYGRTDMNDDIPF